MGTRWAHRTSTATAIVAVSVAAVVATATSVSSAGFSASTATPAAVDAGALTGIHGPAGGIAAFSATRSGEACTLAWGQLTGGDDVADRVELTAEPGGDVLSSVAAGDAVGPNDTTTTTTFTQPGGGALRSFGLRTRRASDWVSAPDEMRTATCVDERMYSVSAGDHFSCAIATTAQLMCFGLGTEYRSGRGDQLTTATPHVAPGTAWRTVDVGGAHVCGITLAEALVCFGEGGQGQLGNGGGTSIAPVDVVPLVDGVAVTGDRARWRSVSAGNDSTCAINLADELWCWGRNAGGMVGAGNTGAHHVPVNVGAALRWASVSVSREHACALSTDGGLHCWGSNDDGQLGLGDATPRLVPSAVGERTDWTQVSAGASHTCALDAAAAMWCWGADIDVDDAGAAPVSSPVPVQVSERSWAHVSAGDRATCATAVDRTMWCRGVNANGRTALGAATGSTAAFTRVGAATWNLVSMGARHGCALRSDDTLHCWGNAGAGATGRGNTEWAAAQAIGASMRWRQLSAGDHHTCGVTEDTEDLHCWGWNRYGQLGDEDAAGVPSTADREGGIGAPVHDSLRWSAVAVGFGHTCAISVDNDLYCWGAGWSGQLGTGSTAVRQPLSPVAVGTKWASVSAGLEFTCAVTVSSALFCWGANANGQLGTGDTVDAATPVAVEPGQAWSSVSIAETHACALTAATQRLWCWGANDYGQLGRGTVTSTAASTPQPIADGGHDGWVAMTTGDRFTCAVHTSAALWCWGSNFNRQLGRDDAEPDHDIGPFATPTEVAAPALAGRAFSAVSAGGRHACALEADDSAIWCWGHNSSGQLGLGAASASSPPQLLAGIAGRADGPFAVPLGKFHSCFVDAGTAAAACSGANEWGQLGYVTSTLEPMPVTGATVWLGA